MVLVLLNIFKSQMEKAEQIRELPGLQTGDCW